MTRKDWTIFALVLLGSIAYIAVFGFWLKPRFLPVWLRFALSILGIVWAMLILVRGTTRGGDTH